MHIGCLLDDLEEACQILGKALGHTKPVDVRMLVQLAKEAAARLEPPPEPTAEDFARARTSDRLVQIDNESGGPSYPSR